jgi:myo-inositol-1-phosphate synthase
MTFINSSYDYKQNYIHYDENNNMKIEPCKKTIKFKTDKTVSKTGVMLVGWSGNNGSTFTAGIFANKLQMGWDTRTGKKKHNYLGSITQSTCIQIGIDKKNNKPVFMPFNKVLPCVNLNELDISGWDITDRTIDKAMEDAQVLDIDLQNQLKPHLSNLKPLPGIYYPEYIAPNQKERANNILPNLSKFDNVQKIRNDIKKFKSDNKLDKVIILWTASTEKMVVETKGVHDTVENLMIAIKNNSPLISPSIVYATAALQEGCIFLNGSPQNTIVPAIIELSLQCNSFVAGSDFKSGQTKIKSMLADYYINTGMKVEYVASYNHLGNNDGLNLSNQEQFKSKEISKSGVMVDAQASNPNIYKSPEDDIEQCVVIKYIKKAKDTKIAMDEWLSSIFLSGEQRLVTYTTCEDSLLAVPLMYDMIVLSELLSRVQYASKTTTTFTQNYNSRETFTHMPPILTLLSYCFKAPISLDKSNVCNILHKQISDLHNFMLILSGLSKSSIIMENFLNC